LQASLFTRLAVAEAELRAMEEILADVLDILAEVKANQDQMRQAHDTRLGRVERLLTDQRRPWWQRLGNDNSIFGRARAPIQARLSHIIALLKDHNKSVLYQIPKDDFVFWKSIGRTVIIGLFLTAAFTIGLYQLLNHN
jgi:hypothetical protein